MDSFKEDVTQENVIETISPEPNTVTKKKLPVFAIVVAFTILLVIVLGYVFLRNHPELIKYFDNSVLVFDESDKLKIGELDFVRTKELVNIDNATDSGRRISPDYDYFIAYTIDPLTDELKMASIISEVLAIKNNKMTLLVKRADPLEIEILDSAFIYTFKKGDKENFVAGVFEDVKVGSIVTYYFPREGDIGRLYVRVE